MYEWKGYKPHKNGWSISIEEWPAEMLRVSSTIPPGASVSLQALHR